MNFKEYQAEAARTANLDNIDGVRTLVSALGLVGVLAGGSTRPGQSAMKYLSFGTSTAN